MTKTQANEPGFVLDAAAKAIYECKGLHLSTGRPWESATAADRYYCLEYAGAALAAAPLVPSPAYGGVRALRLEISEIFADARRQHPVPLGLEDAVHQAVRRLSPVAVEEADAKAVEWVENASALLELNEKGAVSHPVPGLAVSLLRSAIELLSTPSPQIGNAGAGPVGEAVAASRSELQEACDLLEERKYGSPARSPAHNARLVIERILARPVEEPGEVERRIVEIIEPKGDENGVWCGSPLEAVIAVQNERDELRTELAETRERLEKAVAPFVAVLDSMEKAAIGFHRETQPEAAAGLDDADLAALVHPDDSWCFTDGSMHNAKRVTVGDLRSLRASLTGDAQEGGK